MPKRFINCSACRGCHTGRGGTLCHYLSSAHAGVTAGNIAMVEQDFFVPKRYIPDYPAYLADKIKVEELSLKKEQDRCRGTDREQQLSELQLQSSKLESQQVGKLSGYNYQMTFPFGGSLVSLHLPLYIHFYY